ncbi:MAG: hypothetical protein OXT09_23930 [Myxococcales bacterium]|nr:hypothetical protein [Myxococcales bacterium]
MQQLEAYEWPGNVRELQNVIERAVIVSQGDVLTLDQPLRARVTTPPQATLAQDANAPAVPEVSPPAGPVRTLREVEESMIRDALAACRWVIGGKNGAAKRLDMAPSTLRERMQRYGIRRPTDA